MSALSARPAASAALRCDRTSIGEKAGRFEGWRSGRKAIPLVGERASPHPVEVKVMSKQSKETSDTFRPTKRPLTEYEEEQLAIRKNLERLRAERRAREADKEKDA